MMRVSLRSIGILALALCTGTAGLTAARAQYPAWLIQSEAHGNGEPQKPERGEIAGQSANELNTLKDIFTAIRRCYQPPAVDQARPGMRITVQFAYNRDGEIMGKPRVLYETQGTTPEQQSAYRMAVAAALARCSPLPFSKSLGAAVAGRIFAIQFVDERNLRGA